MKTLCTLLFLLLAAVSGHAQTTPAANNHLDPDSLPAAVLQKFIAEQPGITAVWKADGENYKAAFTDPTTKLGRIVVYDKEGNVLRRESEIDQQTAPAPIGDYYKKNHPGETYQVWRSEDAGNGQQLYYSGRNLETIWFDKEGTKLTERKAKKKQDR